MVLEIVYCEPLSHSLAMRNENKGESLTNVGVPQMSAGSTGHKVIAESASKHRTLGEIRHAVVVLLVFHVLAVPVNGL